MSLIWCASGQDQFGCETKTAKRGYIYLDQPLKRRFTDTNGLVPPQSQL